MKNVFQILGMGRKAPAADAAQSGNASSITPVDVDRELSDDEVDKLIDALLGPQKTYEGRYERRSPRPVSPETVNALSRGWQDGPTADEIKTLRETQRKVDAAERLVDAHGRDKVKEMMLASQEAFASATADGKSAGDHVELKTRPQWEDYCASKRTAGKAAIRAACIEAWPVAEVIVTRFISYARGLCREMEREEFRHYQTLGVAYTPSVLTMTLHDLCEGLEVRIEKTKDVGIYPTPKHSTFGIVEL